MGKEKPSTPIIIKRLEPQIKAQKTHPDLSEQPELYSSYPDKAIVSHAAEVEEAICHEKPAVSKTQGKSPPEKLKKDIRPPTSKTSENEDILDKPLDEPSSEIEVSGIDEKPVKKRIKKHMAKTAANKKLPKDERTLKKPHPAPAEKPPKEKTEVYIIKKNKSMKMLRICLWLMIAFIFARGVISSLRLDPMDQVAAAINDFKRSFNGYKERDNEIFSFAQNFAREYLTYDIKGEEDYITRLKSYSSSHVFNAGFTLNGSAKALYVQAYRKEEYSENQFDVYVLASVQYAKKELIDNDLGINSDSTIQQTILKIPILYIQNHYIVEDLPAFVNDDMKISDFKPSEYTGTEIGTSEKEEVKQALSNFFKSYYEDEQSVINYYLAKNADKNQFRGLNKRVKFIKLDSIRCYAVSDDERLALVNVHVKDLNSVTVTQRYNLTLIIQDGRYYIKEMATRNVNIK